MARQVPSLKGIKDIFYEARVLMGRGYTLKRFATEVLEGAVDPVMLSYIEKGKRFPNEALVRRLATARKQDPQELLALLWRDRMLHAFARELRRVIKGGREVREGGMAEADLAFLISRAIAALPDDGSWSEVSRWRRELQKAKREIGKKRPRRFLDHAMDILQAQGLIEIREGKVRRLGRHYVAGSSEERRSLALEFCGIFTKGLLDKLVLRGKDTYVRNHYLHIPEEKILQLHRKLDEAVRRIVEEFATEEGTALKFLNVLITSSPF